MLIFQKTFLMKFRSKLPRVEQSIFTVMAKMAVDHNAINLSQGFPNFPMDPALIALTEKAMVQGFNQYAPMAGDRELREVIVQKLKNLYGSAYDPDTDMTVTAGATQAIFTVLAAMIHPGDEVIIFTPAYDCYIPSIHLFGGKVVPIQLKPPHFKIDWTEVGERITQNTKMILINTPHNPTGAFLSAQDLEESEKIAEKHNLLVLSDEVYEHMVYDDMKHQSVATRPGMAARSFITASFGKTFHNTGWKIGYCVAPRELMEEFQKVHQFNVFCVNHPTQKALATYLKNPENYLQLSDMFQQKRDLFLKLIASSQFKFIPSKGTYFQLLDYSDISDLDDISFSKKLLQTHGVATIPTSVFNESGADFKQVRVCFAKKDETLEEAATVLNTLSSVNF